MSTQAIKDKFKFRDRLINAITTDGKFRVSILKATNMVEDARKRHQLNPVATHIMGELLIGTALSTSMLKGEERITLRLETDSAMKSAVAEGNALGEIRGYIANPSTAANGNTVSEIMSNTIGRGFLHVTKVLYGNSDPVTSSVDLRFSSIIEDLTYFYAQSDQTPTSIRSGIAHNPDGSIKQAGGFLVQALPDATEKDIKQMELNITSIPPLAEQLEKNIYVDEILKDVLLGYEFKELKRRPVDFYCSCSKERFELGLKSIGNLELTHMMNEGQQELTCHYCNEKYVFTSSEIEKLIEW